MHSNIVEVNIEIVSEIRPWPPYRHVLGIVDSSAALLHVLNNGYVE